MSDTSETAVPESSTWSTGLFNLLNSAAQGYLYQRFGMVNDGEQVYMKNDQGQLYPIGQPTPTGGTSVATASGILPYLLIGGGLLVVVLLVSR